MPLSARLLVPVVEPRRRPNHRPGGGRAIRIEASPPPAFEPDSPSRALAITALAVIRHSRRPAGRPAAWSLPGFIREVDLVRLHLRPVNSRRVLAASFGREAFHAAPSTVTSGGGAVAVAYAIRWLELGDWIERPGFEAWLAESASGPVRLPAEGSPSIPAGAGSTIAD